MALVTECLTIVRRWLKGHYDAKIFASSDTVVGVPKPLGLPQTSQAVNLSSETAAVARFDRGVAV